jgi:hypothetical protein
MRGRCPFFLFELEDLTVLSKEQSLVISQSKIDASNEKGGRLGASGGTEEILSSTLIHRQRRISMLPAIGLGLLLGLLLASFSAPLGPGLSPQPIPGKPGPLKNQPALPAVLCTEDHGGRPSHQSDLLAASRHVTELQMSLRGIRNVKRLLPVAKGLTTEALHRTGLHCGLNGHQVQQAESRIISANRILLDKRLSDSAMVDDRYSSEIRIGPICAAALVSDDAAVFILAHELTHIGNSEGDLQALARSVSQEARSIACVSATDWQEEDLACDFIAELVLRRFIGGRPTNKSPEERLCLILASGNPGDKTHLSDAQTLRALIGLDPQLKLMLMKWLGGRQTDDYAIVEPLAME